MTVLSELGSLVLGRALLRLAQSTVRTGKGSETRGSRKNILCSLPSFPGNSEIAADGKELLLAVGTNWSRGHAHYGRDDDYLAGLWRRDREGVY